MVTDHSRVDLKIAVRDRMLEWVAEDRRVLDLYCGTGRMYEEVWHQADSYFGVDAHKPHHLAATSKLSADAAVQMFELDEWNIYDIDCHGSPWKVARRICRKRGSGVFGLVMTSGEYRGFAGFGTNEMIRRSIGATGLSDYRLFKRHYFMIIGLMIRGLGEIDGISLLKGVKAETARHIVYVGLLLDR